MFGQPLDKLGASSLDFARGKSKFVIGFLVAFVVGIFLSDLVKIDPWWLAGVALGLVVTLILFWKDLYWRLILIILIGFVLGFGFYRFFDNRQKSILLPQNQEISFEGQIIGHPDFSSQNARYIVNFQNLKIQVVSGRYPPYQYGDMMEVKGTLEKPNEYYFHQGILGVIYYPKIFQKNGQKGKILTKAVYRLRDKFEDSLGKILSEPYASFAAGLVLGSKRSLPDSLMTDFNRTGTTHIVAVSGYNVTIVIVYIGLFLGIFARKIKFWGSLILILGFVVMTGAPASVVRAGILAALIAWGQFEGRRINLTLLLFLVASLILLFNPYALKFDLSFILSFLAFGGLVYLGPILSNLKIFQHLPDFLKLTLAETLGAQIMVLPILIWQFGRVSLVAPLVNILILPLVPLSMFFVFLIGFWGMIWLSLGQTLAFFSWVFLKYIIIVVESFSKISWASLEIKTSEWWWMVIFYFLIGRWIYQSQRQGKDELFKT